MASAQNIVNEWAADDSDKQRLSKTHSGLVLRWINQGQLRFADKSETLRNVWNPTITSTGNIALPADFLREVPDLVKFNASAANDAPLIKIDYPVANNLSWASTTHYSIWDNTFYVWAAGALTPSIHYIQAPTTITTLSSASLEIPQEYQQDLITFLEAKWLYHTHKVSYADYLAMIATFDETAFEAGLRFKFKVDGGLRTRSVRL